MVDEQHPHPSCLIGSSKPMNVCVVLFPINSRKILAAASQDLSAGIFNLPRMTEPVAALHALATVANVRGYRNLMSLYQQHLGVESLTMAQKKIVTQVTKAFREEDALASRRAAELSLTQVLLFTAYTTDYIVGNACSQVNRMYAERHGYEFHCDVLSYEDMLAAIAPRQFCGWYKVAMICRFLANKEALHRRKIGYIMWIDADAVVVNHAMKVEELLSRAEQRGTYKGMLFQWVPNIAKTKSNNAKTYVDLIIAEDIHPCCLINTGVLLIRLSDWSASLWADVWAAQRYFDVFFYEQSALMRCLKKRHEGLHDVQPFHSYVRGGPMGDKLFPHVCVVPHLDLNSNRCRGLTVDIHASATEGNRRVDTSDNANTEEEMAGYIFHCAGNRRYYTGQPFVSECVYAFSWD
jgi:hypothetical protein